MDNQTQDFLQNSIAFTDSDEQGVYNNLLLENKSYYLHENNYVIDSRYSEYIPIHFFSSDMFNYDIKEKEITNNFHWPIINHSGPAYIDELINRYRYGNKRKNSLTLYSPDSNNYPMFGNGIILDKEGIIFCCCVKTGCIKQIFLDVVNIIADREFTKLMVSKDLHNKEKVKQIITYRLNQYLQLNIDSFYEAIHENMILFVHEEKLNNLTTDYLGEDYINVFKNRYWKCEKIIDNTTNYFNSKVFTQPEIPVFQDIEGPENMVNNVLNEEKSSEEKSLEDEDVVYNVSGTFSWNSLSSTLEGWTVYDSN